MVAATDAVAADAAETFRTEQCTKQLVLIATKRVKFHSYQRKADPFIAGNVTSNTDPHEILIGIRQLYI